MKENFFINALTFLVFLSAIVATGTNAWFKTEDRRLHPEKYLPTPTPASYYNDYYTYPSPTPNNYQLNQDTITPFNTQPISPTMYINNTNPTYEQPSMQGTSTPQTNTYCYDSDLVQTPNEKYVLGYVTLQDSKGVISTTYDSCTENKQGINDMYCYKNNDNFTVESKWENCQNGCFDGSCIR